MEKEILKDYSYLKRIIKNEFDENEIYNLLFNFIYNRLKNEFFDEFDDFESDEKLLKDRSLKDEKILNSINELTMNFLNDDDLICYFKENFRLF